LKKLLWQWSGSRRHALEGNALRSPAATIEALNADFQKTEAPSDHKLFPASTPDGMNVLPYRESRRSNQIRTNGLGGLG
jgi:hypothetical protein